MRETSKYYYMKEDKNNMTQSNFQIGSIAYSTRSCINKLTKNNFHTLLWEIIEQKISLEMSPQFKNNLNFPKPKYL